MVSLEDYGEIEGAVIQQAGKPQALASQDNIATPQPNKLPAHVPHPAQVPPSGAGAGAGTGAPPQLYGRETAEYQAALQLEMWKKSEEARFKVQMQEKEATLLRMLAEEWKARDKDRQLVMKRKVDEYEKLEAQLKDGIAEVEKREQSIVLQEQELERQRSLIEKELAGEMATLREAAQRMQQDMVHQNELARLREDEFKSQVARAEKARDQSETRYQRVFSELEALRNSKSETPEVQLKADANLCKGQVFELEQKLSAAIRSKRHYKAQWSRSLQELAKMRHREQLASTTKVKQDQKELEHMRMRYLAREEKELMGTEMRELQNIKKQLVKLAESANRSDANGRGPSSAAAETKILVGDDAELSRLVQERALLLRTQVYAPNSKIIQELDAKIEQLSGSRARTEPVDGGLNDSAMSFEANEALARAEDA